MQMLNGNILESDGEFQRDDRKLNELDADAIHLRQAYGGVAHDDAVDFPEEIIHSRNVRRQCENRDWKSMQNSTV